METHAAVKIVSTKRQLVRRSFIRKLSVLAMFVVASDLHCTAIGKLDGLSGAPFNGGISHEAGPHSNNLPIIIEEVLPLNPAPL